MSAMEENMSTMEKNMSAMEENMSTMEENIAGTFKFYKKVYNHNPSFFIKFYF